jgi:hypothetical protein
MTKLQLLEHEVKKLKRPHLAVFRNWFHKFDAVAWDRQVEGDVRSGKLDTLARQAIADHRAGKTREL